jgi:glutathione peroxidase
LLLVNVASKCGYTRQYKPLEETYRKYKAKGLVVIGIPSNDFGGQEPGTPDEIKAFCESKFDVTFPLMEKVQVKSGAGQHPLYAALTGKDSPFPGEVKWNFGKFLIGRDGKIVARFQSADEPDSEAVIKAIEVALAAKEELRFPEASQTRWPGGREPPRRFRASVFPWDFARKP